MAEGEDHVSRINFYSSFAEYYEFSNFSNHAVVIDGKVWKTTEHYYQAMKFHDNPEYQEEIRLAKTPAIAKKLGGTRKVKLHANWDTEKEKVMMVALRAKFTQHKALGKLLLSTGTAYLSEHTKNDLYWGDGLDDSGKNRLGHLLMELRTELAKKST
jgi:ribA/ribD-fused uncharacterized protein